MKDRLLILFVLLFVYCGNSKLTAQDKNDNIFYFKLPGEAAHSRVIVSPKKLSFERYHTYNVDQPFWKLDKELIFQELIPTKQGYRIIGKKGEQFFGGEYWFEDNQQQLYLFQLNQAGDSLASIKQLLDQFKHKDLMAKVAYSKNKWLEIEQYPSLDSLNKTDLILLLNHIYAQEERVAASGEEQRIIWQMGHAILRRKCIAMGFDPDKVTNGYFLKRFTDDPDISKLLERQVHLKTY